MIVDAAVYDASGRRRPGTVAVEDALAAVAEPGTFAWIGLFEPTAEELESVQRDLGLHELAVEDAIRAHQRPKLDAYDGDLFVVLKTARYDDAREAVDVGEIQVFVGAGYVVSVRHGEASSLGDVRAELEREPERLRWGPMAILHAIVDRVVDAYVPVLQGLDNDMAEIETDVFDPARARGFDPSQRIFKLKREVLELHRNTEPFLEPLGRLVDDAPPGTDPALASYFRDVEDHLTRVVAAVNQLRALLTDLLEANLALVTVRQNDDMRAISAWVAIGGIPTVIGAVYGMNFEHMPELGWRYGYAAAVVVMVAVCLALWRRFKRIGWL